MAADRVVDVSHGGVGVYRFDASNAPGGTGGALSFSCSEDGSGPRVGVAFHIHFDSKATGWGVGQWSAVLHSAVSTDLAVRAAGHSSSGKGDLEDFYNETAGAGADNQYAVGTTNNMTIWGTLAPMPTTPGNPWVQTLTVWVRDISSTFGMG